MAMKGLPSVPGPVQEKVDLFDELTDEDRASMRRYELSQERDFAGRREALLRILGRKTCTRKPRCFRMGKMRYRRESWTFSSPGPVVHIFGLCRASPTKPRARVTTRASCQLLLSLGACSDPYRDAIEPAITSPDARKGGVPPFGAKGVSS